MVDEGLALDYIDKHLRDFLLNNHPRIPVFYILPKVHKPGVPPVERPIVAAQGSLLEPTSQYIDSILQPFVKQVPTFILDTTDFIRKVEGLAIPEEVLLVSLDVTSLYTNIPHEDLRLTLQNVLDMRPDPHPPTHFLLDLIDILIDKNYFRYDNSYYLQIRGVAMDSAFAPSTANLFMSMLEQQHILSPSSNPYFGHIFKYFRFIDDIFCVYTDINSFDSFLD